MLGLHPGVLSGRVWCRIQISGAWLNSSVEHLLFPTAPLHLLDQHRCARVTYATPQLALGHLLSCSQDSPPPSLSPRSSSEATKKIVVKVISMATQKMNLELPKVAYKLFLTWFLPTPSTPCPPLTLCLGLDVPTAVRSAAEPVCAPFCTESSGFVPECATLEWLFYFPSSSPKLPRVLPIYCLSLHPGSPSQTPI